MKIVKPYAKLLPLQGRWEDIDGMATNYYHFTREMGLKLLQHIEWCARISHRSEDSVTSDSWKRIIQSVVLDHGDWSVVEHASVSADVYVDRGITHEWVRHRLFSYTQESTRFVNYEKKIPPAFIYPIPDVECKYCLSGREVVFCDFDSSWKHLPVNTVSTLGEYCAYSPAWLFSIMQAENAYKRLLSTDFTGYKWRPQEARSVFPNALGSRLVVTGNLRNWRHFFIMRTSAETHPQMKQVTIPLLKEFQEKIPMLFDDIIPGEKQSLALAKAR